MVAEREENWRLHKLLHQADLIAAYWFLVSASHYACLRTMLGQYADKRMAYEELVDARGRVLDELPAEVVVALCDDHARHSALMDRHKHILALEQGIDRARAGCRDGRAR